MHCPSSLYSCAGGMVRIASQGRAWKGTVPVFARTSRKTPSRYLSCDVYQYLIENQGSLRWDSWLAGLRIELRAPPQYEA
jgi:hypothetical protein